MSENRIVFVQIDASDDHGSVIYGKYAFGSDPNGAKADAARFRLEHGGLVDTSADSVCKR